jgi:hypothetical protein
VAFLVAALFYWISDQAYSIHWIVGLPFRLLAFMFGVTALFTA